MIFWEISSMGYMILTALLGLRNSKFNTLVILFMQPIYLQNGLLEQMPTYKHSTSRHKCVCFISQCPWEHIYVTRLTLLLMEWNILERILLNKKSVLLLDLAGSMMLKTLPREFEKYSLSDVCLNNIVILFKWNNSKITLLHKCVCCSINKFYYMWSEHWEYWRWNLMVDKNGCTLTHTSIFQSFSGSHFALVHTSVERKITLGLDYF